MSWLSNIDKKQLVLNAVFIGVVGVISAFTSIVLCLCVDTAYHISQAFAWTVLLLPLMGLISLIFYRAMKLPYDYGTDDMVLQMRENKPVSPTLAPSILVGTCLSMLAGGAVGKESSAFQMGASIGEMLGRGFKLKNIFKNKQDRNVYGYAALMGMAATFSALFFAPLGATFLVFELTRFKTFSPARFIAVLVAAVISASIASIFGIGDIIPKVNVPGLSPDLMLQVVLVGTLGGVLGHFFGGSIRIVRQWQRKTLRHPFASVVVVGFVIAAIVMIFNLQTFEGSGMNLLTQALGGSIGTWDFAIKALLVFLALASGFKGGEIMPTLVIGGLLGCSLGQVIGLDPAFAGAIGVMSFFAGMSRAPIAAFFLGFEIFGVETIPFFLAAIVFAYFGSRGMGYYGHGALGEERAARKERKILEQFFKNNPNAAAAIKSLEQQSNEHAHEAETVARKEAQTTVLPQMPKAELKQRELERKRKEGSVQTGDSTSSSD